MLWRGWSCVEGRMVMCSGEDVHVLRGGWSCVEGRMVMC